MLGAITAILKDIHGPESAGWAEVAPLVYEELRSLARAYMSTERAGGIMQPTSLVHETYLRLVQQKANQWKNRRHFYGVAALFMRYILVEQARRRDAEQRALTVAGDELLRVGTQIELPALTDALGRLEQLDPRQCRIVELRYFGGLSVQETAEILGVSTKTVRRDWLMARAWLHAELTGSAP